MSATATRPSVEQVWAWLGEVPDPEIPAVSVVDLGIVRDVRWDDGDEPRRHRHADLFRLPGHRRHLARDRAALCATRASSDVRLERRIAPPWTTDWISRRRPRASCAPTASSRRSARRRGAGAHARPQAARDRLPALRLDRHRAGQRVRLDALQGAVPLPGLPGALRLLQVPLMAAFHPLTVTGVRRETRDSIVLTLAPPEAERDAFRFIQGQYLTLRTTHRRRGGAPLLLDLRRGAGARAAGRHQEDRRRPVLDLGQRGGRAGRRRSRRCRPWATSTCRSIPRRHHHYLGFAAGSGITPLLSIVKTTLAAEPHSRFTLVYGNRASSSIMFREELEDLKNEHLDRLALIHILSREQQDIELFNGRIDKAKCEAAARPLARRRHRSTPPSSAGRRT